MTTSADKNMAGEPEEPANTAKAKPLVHYKQLVLCKMGSGALVVPVDHPSELVSNRGPIYTSPVVDGPDVEGRFETANTRYAPLPKLN
jgi:hypothetical protein